MANAWFRLYAEFSTDPKVQMLSESDQRRLIMLFCFRCNGDVTLHDEEVTFLLRISNDEWDRTKELFIAKGFINESNEILNWDKRQFTSDTSKSRVAAYRERKKQSSNNDVTLQKRYSNAIDTDTDTDTDTDNKKTTQKNNFFAGIDQQIVTDYLAVRKAKRAPAVSKTVFDGLIREAKLAGISLDQALRVCIERNWVGFKADWYANAKTTTHQSIAEQNKLSTEIARQKLFGNLSAEKDITNETTTI